MTHVLRNELKYQIPIKQKNTLIQRLNPILKLDPHSNDEGYWVKSLYFDDYQDSALNDNLDGVQYRNKFRYGITIQTQIIYALKKGKDLK